MDEARYKFTGVRIAGTPGVITQQPANPMRVWIMIVNNGTGQPVQLLINTGPSGVFIDVPNNTNVEVFYSRHGPLPGFAFSVIGGAVGGFVCVDTMEKIPE